MVRSSAKGHFNVALVGGGIMSATLASLFGELLPDLTITAFERLDEIAKESSQVMNNAGTGHAGNCELNYTPELHDGTVDIEKALAVNAAFEVSMQLWAHLVERGKIPDAQEFIKRVPHISFVWGEDNVRYMQTRHRALNDSVPFSKMLYTEDRKVLEHWMPLIMEERGYQEPLAATRVDRATDVDFGRLTQLLFSGLDGSPDHQLHLRHEVTDLTRHPDGGWKVDVKDFEGNRELTYRADFVFLGGGGGTLPLLQKSGIPEAAGYGGFPVGGQWLICSDPDIVHRHHAKVYGKAALGAPPMSLPHLDTRYWQGRQSLLFGPFAGFTTKYLKQGSYFDLFKSLRSHNLGPILAVARDNWDLTQYLVEQALQSPASRFAALREFVPGAAMEDWQLAAAGQRVQIIKRDLERTGRLQFGTEVVTAADGSLSALLGASPGASTAVPVMLELLRKCFPERTSASVYHCALRNMIPSLGHDLTKNANALSSVRERVNSALRINVRH